MKNFFCHMPSRGRRLIALIVMILAAYGCASGPTIVGNWKAVEGAATVNFAADGGFQAVDNQGMPVSGKYRLVGANVIQFEIAHDGENTETIEARVIRTGERLTLAFPGENAVESYERIP